MTLKIQDAYYRHLLFWNLTNLILGVACMIAGYSFLKHCGSLTMGLGIITIVWGIIGVIIAFAKINEIIEKIYSLKIDSYEEKEGTEEKDVFSRLSLPAVTLFCGIIIIFSSFWSEKLPVIIESMETALILQGIGWGMFIQSFALLFFEAGYIKNAAEKTPGIKVEEIYKNPKHRSFKLEGGNPAVLLIHSLTGTPVQMLHLGKELHKSGITVQGLLLPGFGPEISKLTLYNNKEWISAIQKTVLELKEKHNPVMLAGYSTGSAFCINAAVNSPVDGMILIAPLIFREDMERKIFRLFLPHLLQPFGKANFSRPEVLQGLKKVLPDLNIDDGDSMRAIRQFTVPVTAIDEIKTCFDMAMDRSSSVKKPVLVIWPEKDKDIDIETTELTINSFSGNVKQERFNTGHDMILEKNPEWKKIKKVLLNFIQKTDLVF